ncbi:MAG: hypothetical protein P4L46_05970 [Fimbriimonas sp.]|nr:hypothetical protein [Fimbriimonas sp.]
MNNDRFWVLNGNTAKIRCYFQDPGHNSTSNEPHIYVQSVDYRIPPGTEWHIGPSQYTPAERALLRRQVHSAGIGKGIGDSNTGLVFPKDGDTVHGASIPIVLHERPGNSVLGVTARFYNRDTQITLAQTTGQVVASKIEKRPYALILLTPPDLGTPRSRPSRCEITVSYTRGRPATLTIYCLLERTHEAEIQHCIDTLTATEGDPAERWEHVTHALQKALEATSYCDTFMAIQQACHANPKFNLVDLASDDSSKLCITDFGREIGVTEEGMVSLLVQDPIVLP